VICGFYFLQAQRKKSPVVELNLAMDEPVISLVNSDSTDESIKGIEAMEDVSVEMI